MTTPQHGVLLFDGVCNLCNGFVQFVIQRDPEGYFQYASLQSETGQQLLKEYGLDDPALDSVILIEGGRAYTHSDVPLRIAPRLRGFWSWSYPFRWIPRFIRDAVYRWVARNRYRWFGKQNECMLPRAEWRGRFLS